MLTRPRTGEPGRGSEGRGARVGRSPRDGEVGAMRTRSGRTPAFSPIRLTSDGRDGGGAGGHEPRGTGPDVADARTRGGAGRLGRLGRHLYPPRLRGA